MSGPAPGERGGPDDLFHAYLALSHIIAASPESPLAPLPGEAPEETPRYYVARAAWGATYTLIRPDLSAALHADLSALASDRALTDPDAVMAIFALHHTICWNIWLGRTARFPTDLDPALAAGVVALPAGLDVYGEAEPPHPERYTAAPSAHFVPRQFAVIADGLVVATCESSRESGVAAEAWVRTLPAYRGRGYARRVTAAWALDARARAKEPFYSHHRDNLASAAVARALGLVPFLEDAGYL